MPNFSEDFFLFYSSWNTCLMKGCNLLHNCKSTWFNSHILVGGNHGALFLLTAYTFFKDEVQRGSSTLMRIPRIHDRRVTNNFSKQQIRIKTIFYIMLPRREQVLLIQSKWQQMVKCPSSWTFQENIWLYSISQMYWSMVLTQLFLP